VPLVNSKLFLIVTRVAEAWQCCRTAPAQPSRAQLSAVARSEASRAVVMRHSRRNTVDATVAAGTDGGRYWTPAHKQRLTCQVRRKPASASTVLVARTRIILQSSKPAVGRSKTFARRCLRENYRHIVHGNSPP
jgi:hypothetical protein